MVVRVTVFVKLKFDPCHTSPAILQTIFSTLLVLVPVPVSITGLAIFPKAPLGAPISPVSKPNLRFCENPNATVNRKIIATSFFNIGGL